MLGMGLPFEVRERETDVRKRWSECTRPRQRFQSKSLECLTCTVLRESSLVMQHWWCKPDLWMLHHVGKLGCIMERTVMSSILSPNPNLPTAWKLCPNLLHVADTF